MFHVEHLLICQDYCGQIMDKRLNMCTFFIMFHVEHYKTHIYFLN